MYLLLLYKSYIMKYTIRMLYHDCHVYQSCVEYSYNDITIVYTLYYYK